MKQHITRKQWQELTLGEQRRFQEALGRGGFPTIGDMIEFLSKSVRDDWSIHFGKNLAFVAFATWREGLYGKTPQQRRGQLCDGLWDCVKFVLCRHEVKLRKKDIRGDIRLTISAEKIAPTDKEEYGNG